MSIKPFYVFMPTRDEAVEIVDRAFANGARVVHSVSGMDCDSVDSLPYDDDQCWGVDGDNEVVNDSRIGFPDDADQLTMPEVRAILPCEKYDGATKEKWNGEGLPPVGVRAVVENEAGHRISDMGLEFLGIEVTVMAVFINENNDDMVAVSKPNGCCICFRADMLRPIRTKRDKWIDAAMLAGGIRKRDGAREVYGNLYDAGLAKDIEE